MGENNIKYDSKNYRKHTEKNLNLIKKSLKECGTGRSILIDNQGEIIAGNATFKQAQAANIPVKIIETDGKELIALKRTDLKTDDEKRKKLALLDNSTSDKVEWDLDNLSADFDLGELPELGIDDLPEIIEEDAEITEDEVPEDVETRCKKGDIWQLGEHRLMCGDSTKVDDVEKLMNGEKADMVLTDPPYNVAIENSQGMTIQNDDMSNERFLLFLTNAFYCLNLYLKEGGAFYVWFASREHINFETALNKNNLIVRQELIWNKNSLILGRQDYQWKHEPCLYGWKDGATHYFIDDRKQTTVIEDKKPDFKKMKKEEMQKLLEEIYSDKFSATIMNENKPIINDLHPTMKPLKLIARQIKNSSKINEIIFDLFGGSGSTIMACEQLNRKCYTMELDPHYCDVIITRWEKLTGQEAKLCK